MAEEQQVVRGISWTEAFGFSHIFKSFKMAIYPRNLALAFLAVALTFVLGRCVMDPLWSLVKSSAVHNNEAWLLWYGWAEPGAPPAPATREAFMLGKNRWLNEGRVGALASYLGQYPAEFANASKSAREDFGGALKKLRGLHARDYDEARKQVESRWQERRKLAEEKADKTEKAQALKETDVYRAAETNDALRRRVEANNNLDSLTGPGIFGGFLDWEHHCLTNAFVSLRRLNFTGGMTLLFQLRGSATPLFYRARADINRPPIDASLVPSAGGRTAPFGQDGFGLLCWLVLMAWGLWWMICVYPIYAVAYILLALAVWSVLGGAICRMAALHAAREEKISLASALKFSLSRFFSFFTAPLLPLAIILALGAVLVIGGLFGALPYGEWFAAALFPVALILGLMMTFLTIGLTAGGPLMWPTIAAEGSDGFDAISRSFSYVFARPFRYGLYWVVAAVYGALCYLFVRLFAYVTLRIVHWWSGWAMGLGWGSRDFYAPGAGKLDVMWPEPTFDSFTAPLQSEATGASEWLAAHVLNFWVYVVAGVVLAFLACFLFSAATNMYFLLRRQVDATDLDDVYVEQPEEEPAPAAAQAPAAGPAGQAKPDEAAPQAQPPAPEAPKT